MLDPLVCYALTCWCFGCLLVVPIAEVAGIVQRLRGEH